MSHRHSTKRFSVGILSPYVAAIFHMNFEENKVRSEMQKNRTSNTKKYYKKA